MAGTLPSLSQCGNSCAGSSTTVIYTSVGFYTLETIAELREIAASDANKQATIGSDALIGLYRWDSDSTAADDGSTVITPTGYSGAGRWIKLI